MFRPEKDWRLDNLYIATLRMFALLTIVTCIVTFYSCQRAQSHIKVLQMQGGSEPYVQIYFKLYQKLRLSHA